jgi:hypothetical protein
MGTGTKISFEINRSRSFSREIDGIGELGD